MSKGSYNSWRIGPIRIGYLWADEPHKEFRGWFKIDLGALNYITRIQIKW